MWAYRLSAKAYQLLIDRGWRRSGQYCYKPFLKQSCCPAYTIRCEALNVKVTRSQKKVIKRMNQFLQHDHRPKNWNRSQRQDPDMDSTKDPLLEMQDHVQAENIFLSSSTATASRMGPVACVSTFRTEYNTVDKTQAADTINVDDLKLLMDKVKSHSSKAKCKRMLKHVDRLIRSAHIDELAAFGRMRQKHLQRIDRCNAEDTLELLLHSSPSLSEAKHKLEVFFRY